MRFVIVKDSHPEKVKLRTIEAVAKILRSIGEVEILDFKPALIEKLKKNDIVFSLAIGKRHDFIQGNIAAMLEGLNVKFVGSPAYTHYICLDKFTTKSLLKAYDIPTPQCALFDGKEFKGSVPKPPLIVKPAAEGSGIGINSESLCESIELAEKVAKKKFERFNEPILVEKYVEGRELTIGLVGFGDNLKMLPPLEIDFSNLPQGIEKYYSQRVKEEYMKQTVYRCPALLKDGTIQKVQNTAKEVFKIVKARDYLRIDMRLFKDEPYVIEVNSMPGLDPETSDIPKMIEAMPKGYDWLIKSIVRRASEFQGV